jgi:hypothetical protein
MPSLIRVSQLPLVPSANRLGDTWPIALCSSACCVLSPPPPPCARARRDRAEQEKQLAWQSVKKATGGNTAWAGNPAGTVVMFSLSVGFGLFILTKGLTDLSLGLNKYR